MDDMIHSELASLLDELRTVEDAITLLTAQRTPLREQISQCVAQQGGRVLLPGYGRLEITAPGVTISYDRHQVEALIIALTTTDPTIAARLAACRKESPRNGGLRITPPKLAA
jgi:hypothetical protein